MWPFKKKLEKVSIEELCDEERELDKQYKKVKKEYDDIQAEIKELNDAGRKEADKNQQRLYANKIVSLNGELQNKIRALNFIEYKRTNLRKLKGVSEINAVYSETTKSPLGNIMNGKELPKYLDKTSENLREIEENEIYVRDTFGAFEESSMQDSAIGGISTEQDQILSNWANEETVQEEEEMRKQGSEETQETN